MGAIESGGHVVRAARDGRAPSMADVARLAAVSHQTVSRVLNDHPNVRPETRTRVRAAMLELGYRPNSAARALVTGRSRVIGIVAQNTTLFGPVSMLSAVQRALDAEGLTVAVASVATFTGSAIADAVDRLLEQRVGGLVVLAPVTSAMRAVDELPEDLPVVVVDGDPSASRRVVTVDQALGGRLATEYLLAAGHPTVWHVSGPADWFDSAGRQDGWREALRSNGSEIPAVVASDWSLAGGYEAGRRLARIPEVSAVFAANDHLAIGIMKSLREAGRAVPEEVSLVGFDDVPECDYLPVPLTTVRPDFERVAAAALSLLLEQVSLPAETRLVGDPVAPVLVERASVASYRG